MKRPVKEARRNQIRPMLTAELGEVIAGSEISQPIMLTGTRTLIYPIYPIGG